jgi:hypothetical protein
MDGIGAIVLLAIGLLLYFLPTVIGWRKRNVTAIFVLNLFLGWSVIGWIIALVWACTADVQPTIIQNNVSTPPSYTSQTSSNDQLQLLDRMRTSGKLSNDEYWEERKRLNLL